MVRCIPVLVELVTLSCLVQPSLPFQFSAACICLRIPQNYFKFSLKLDAAASKCNLETQCSTNFSTTASSVATSTCRLCRRQFVIGLNGPRDCFHHPGRYTGRLNRVSPSYHAEQHDQQVSGGPCSLEFFWSCCGAYGAEAPGCRAGPHRGYDDE
mmetsp:Transcript_37212/g.99029  ORF Transcript_37212/g.99029 Transcript_37212/m.99029 type:complete len:155 (+) Transcript_37212:1-465(+)